MSKGTWSDESPSFQHMPKIRKFKYIIRFSQHEFLIVKFEEIQKKFIYHKIIYKYRNTFFLFFST